MVESNSWCGGRLDTVTLAVFSARYFNQPYAIVPPTSMASSIGLIHMSFIPWIDVFTGSDVWPRDDNDTQHQDFTVEFDDTDDVADAIRSYIESIGGVIINDEEVVEDDDGLD